jgi:TM2 domain-containing membrane protein YozV
MGTGKDHLDSVAAGYAMLVMLLLIIPILCSIILFIVRIAKRERENFDASLSDL